MLLLLLIPVLALGQNSTCCPKKIHSGNSYILSGEDASSVTMYGCLDSCVYEMAGTPGSRYCFKAGGLETTCDNAGMTPTPGVSSTAPTTTQTNTGCVCGRKKESRIVGGQNAEVNEWPWMAALAFSPNGNPQDYGCGATLISDEWFVTASHCFYENGMKVVRAADISLVLGDHDRSTATETTLTEVFGVALIITHPNYDDNLYKNDIALLKVNRKVDLLKHTPACLPPSLASYTGQTGWVYGWGTLSSGGIRPNILQEIDLPVVSYDLCNNAMNTNANVDIYPGMVCAGGQAGRDSCQGDSGGPFTVANASNRHELVGVVSFGIGCAQGGLYGVYSDVAYYRSWIEGQIASNGGATYCPS